MAHPTTFEIESPAWLRNLRWTVIAGIAAAVAGARILGAEFPSNTIFMILGAFALEPDLALDRAPVLRELARDYFSAGDGGYSAHHHRALA
jgi:hypothetical protein